MHALWKCRIKAASDKGTLSLCAQQHSATLKAQGLLPNALTWFAREVLGLGGDDKHSCSWAVGQ